MIKVGQFKVSKSIAYESGKQGDRGAAIGGLVANTTGGLSIGLGIIGKISDGDNQTLGAIVKTAASRLAARATFAAACWSLEQLPETSCANGPNGYIVFPQ